MPKQNGYIGWILLIIALPVLLLVLLAVKPNNTPSLSESCLFTGQSETLSYDILKAVNQSDPSTVVNFLKQKATNAPYNIMTGTYQKIRAEVAIPVRIIPFHFGKAGTIKISGKDTQVWVPINECDSFQANSISGGCKDNNVAAVNFLDLPGETRTQGFNLLYTEVPSETVSFSGVKNQFKFFNVYLNSKVATPSFIKNYCDLYAGNGKNSFAVKYTNESEQPPKTINLDSSNPKITNYFTRPGDNGETFTLDTKRRTDGVSGDYQLVSYSPIDSPFVKSQQIDRANISLSKPILATYQEGSTVYWLGYVSFARFIILIDQSNLDTVYYYAQKITESASPTPEISAQPNLQLRTLTPYPIEPMGWWTPECKPAIYLYPTEKTNFNVRVNPTGFLTYTDPLYPTETGWNVHANPTGEISFRDKTYPYLYYESKIRDEAIDIPSAGLVSTFTDLNKNFDFLLPRLGLNQKEKQDFKEYWNKYLPYSEYYFLGIMSENSIEKIEPLTINPAPDTTIRVRIYFQPMTQLEAIKKQSEISQPIFSSKPRLGSTVIEWGGMVKQDKLHPFTCSM